MSTKIEWCTETWSPIVGCEKISPGCSHCYAEKFAIRLANMNKTSYYKSVTCKNAANIPSGWNGKTILNKSVWDKPFYWKKSRMIFVCSMGDLFHESVPFEWIEKVYDIILSTSHHTYQILTKRPERAFEFFEWFGNKIKQAGFDSVPSQSDNPFDYFDMPNNLWLGVTAENQEMVYKRIPILLQIPAKIRFVSCEPLLSEIDIFQYLKCYKWGKINISPLNWVIAGPETGYKVRSMEFEWINDLYAQCATIGVPFFDKKNILGMNFKQYPK